MKELSIEKKAKRYDEALAKAAKIHRNYKGRVRAVDVVIEEVFPELKESEDERIRKEICKLLWDNAPYEEAQEYIAWLEKQGNINPTEDELEALRMAAYEPTKNWSEKLQSLYEKLTHCEQKPVNKAEPKFEIGDNIEPIDTCLGSPRTIYKICDGFYETNQGTLDFEFENNWRLIEQKPAWSEEDERIYMSIMYSFAHNYPLTIQQQEFVKSIKERVQLQPKQEWTEEDELIIKRIKSLLYSINENDFKDIHAWLKFLKNRVQPKQEWSEEDKEVINLLLELIYEQDKMSPRIPSNEKRKMMLSWLKSLIPQITWKPSNEQMEALWSATEKYLESDNENVRTLRGKVLESLYKDLKKLREE